MKSHKFWADLIAVGSRVTHSCQCIICTSQPNLQDQCNPAHTLKTNVALLPFPGPCLSTSCTLYFVRNLTVPIAPQTADIRFRKSIAFATSPARTFTVALFCFRAGSMYFSKTYSRMESA